MPPLLDIMTLRLAGFLMISFFCLIMLILWKKNNDILGIKEGFAYSLLISVEAGISIFPILRTHEIIVHLANLLTILAYFSLTIAVSKLCKFKFKFKYTMHTIILFLLISFLAYLGFIPREVRVWFAVLYIVGALGSAIYIILHKNIFLRNIGRKFILYWISFHLIVFVARICIGLSLSGEIQMVLNSWTLLFLILSNIFIMLGLIIMLVFRRRNQLRSSLSKAKRASKVKTVFLSNMSHDLRTPLNAIIGFSEMMDKEILGKVEHKKYAEYIHDINVSSKYLLRLVNDILDISAIDAGKRELIYEEHSLQEITQECYSILHQSAKDKNIALNINISDDIPPVNGDRQAIMQILINVLSNAIKYTLDNGSVDLNIEVSNNNHVIKIIDNGVGISEENLRTIHIPFNRGHIDPYRAQQEGKGLGLSIAAALIELHKGTLTIDSEIDKGTTVNITLPTK